MTRIQRLARNEAAVRGGTAGARASVSGSKTRNPSTRSERRRDLNAAASPEGKKKKSFSLQTLRIADLYRPIKKPVTLRLDADVLAWFKKDGSRYQTRINSALRKVMEREIKAK
jgi:uncharacterized protein (DUF4415 family)